MSRRGFIAGSVAGFGLAWLPAASRAQVIDLNDAINKAGRQRMLSQRMAKSYFAVGQEVELELADRTLAASMALFDRQLVELKVFSPLPEIKATYSQLESSWSDYKAALVGSRPDKAQAEQVIALAGKVLGLANTGTGQLEKVSGKSVGKLVNIAGRQRMLSQRMAAFYFSASWGVQAQMSTAEMNKAREDFIAAHELLKKAPEATPAIKAELELAEMQWGFFDSALRTLKPGTSDKRGMTNVFTTSERILQVMDSVTGMYSKLG
ncbi:type IV pili methyl-accepting chemotaxis transducer N-terminal domain-containing protein [Piscinibacter sp.]|uniref:type IV pili methyl-accepting chemotaxis transducer N-terminal domain-containing protein n=1 Tax=Piscinibacter sp. TaxID=1903157 RepID=UPI002B8C1C70|nr:type IV pili methyl-accepting chemotaxis transducer N-terminal domain-containing protein [Albitalea sp.]HUG24338.1 type IV pili methyl-accepting chemotaxis transducer N-terminal domain-containing protein [Albitalea sp.]